MYFQSKIIVEIFTYLQEYEKKEVEDLFSNAIDLFNALGSWIYGGASPKIIYPELQLFIRKTNSIKAENFSLLIDYINWAGNTLFETLENNQWIEEHYYESYTLKKSNDVTTGLFFMWRLGWLIVRIKEISDENKILPDYLNSTAFHKLFDAFGAWIYHQEEINNINRSFQEFKTLFDESYNPLYEHVLEEAKKTRDNIAKFLREL
jgi:hypothetical protein